jgi:transcriptional regulator with XRE-family HTH domain
MSHLEYSKRILSAMEYSLKGLELDMRYDVMNFIIKNMGEQNYSQKKLAQLVGMKESQLSKILSGEINLTLKTIARFFKEFQKKPAIIEQAREKIASEPLAVRYSEVNDEAISTNSITSFWQPEV